jgi:hypothetical protein
VALFLKSRWSVLRQLARILFDHAASPLLFVYMAQHQMPRVHALLVLTRPGMEKYTSAVMVYGVAASLHGLGPI